MIVASLLVTIVEVTGQNYTRDIKLDNSCKWMSSI